MEEGRMVFAIKFQSLLYKICLVLGFPEPRFQNSAVPGGACQASVVVVDGTKEYVFSGDSGSCFLNSAERASKKMVMHLVKEYGLSVDDVSLQFCAKYARVCSVFGLKRKQLGYIGKGASCMLISDELPANAYDAAVPVVSIDFFKLLTRILAILKIGVTPVEYLQFQGGDFMAWMSVECAGFVAGCKWFESGRCKSAHCARECLSRTVICALMPLYHFQVMDVNFDTLWRLILTAEMERESFLTIQEKVSRDQVENDVLSPADLARPSIPTGSDFVIHQSTVPPMVPRKRARVVSRDQNQADRFAILITDAVVSAALDLGNCSGQGNSE